MMMDAGVQETERIFRETKKKIEEEYKTAVDGLYQKYVQFEKDFARKREAHLAELAAGEITRADYEDWLNGQVFIGRRWKTMVKTMTEDLILCDQRARQIASKSAVNAYCTNYNFSIFSIEVGTNIDTGLTLYNRKAVENLILSGSDLLPPPKKVNWKKAEQWNRKHLQSALAQGILQGEDLKTIAGRLSRAAGMSEKTALRSARTMMTGAQNKGRQDCYFDAEKIGVSLGKGWRATLDHHTRDSHRDMDGEEVKLNEKFSNGLEYPGDPAGKPEEVYNCRCVLYGVVGDEQPEKLRRFDNEEKKVIQNMTYRQWETWKNSQSG